VIDRATFVREIARYVLSSPLNDGREVITCSWPEGERGETCLVTLGTNDVILADVEELMSCQRLRLVELSDVEQNSDVVLEDLSEQMLDTCNEQ
jgi:hypothetical protein